MAVRTGATLRALRYYEAAGLVVPARAANGYRDYSEADVALVRELRALVALGLRVQQTAPFLACLRDGHRHSDDCPTSLAEYRSAIRALDDTIAPLVAKRAALAQRLEAAAGRGFPPAAAPAAPPAPPAPAPAARAAPALTGRRLPRLVLPSTAGDRVALDELPGLTVLYLYPLSGRPGVDLPEGWETVPGARGCTAEACGFRDHHSELRVRGVDALFGLSSQDVAYQRELSARLGLPYALLSDPALALARALALPTLQAGGATLYQRLTLVVRDGVVRHCFHPIPDPAGHAAEVLRWLDGGEVR